MLAPYGLRTYKIYSYKSSVVRIRLLIVGKPRFDSVTLYALERFSLDCRKVLVLVLVLVLLRPLVGLCIYFGFGFMTVK